MRDTLFRACGGYANGMIGDDVYGLITSRYGELLITLMLAEAMQAKPTAVTLQSVLLGASVANQTSGTAPNKNGQSATPPTTDMSGAANKQPAAAAEQVRAAVVGFCRATRPEI